MATARQVESNRLNALKSTGPRTAEGKARSRANALDHGMAGTGVVVEEANAAEFDRRREAWAADFRPTGEAGDWALDRAVGASLRIERSERAFDALIARQAGRAALAWDLDRRVEAAALAARLSNQPELVARKLATTSQGAAILIETWMRLGDALRANRDLDEAERSTALDLLGLPADLRRGRTPLDPADGADPLLHLRDLIVEEVDRLESIKAEALDPLDDLDRRQAESGASGFFSKEARLILRYEREAWRRYREAVRDLRGRPVANPEPAPPRPADPTPAPARTAESSPTATSARPAVVPASPRTSATPARPAGGPVLLDLDSSPFSYVDIAATPAGR